MMQKNWNNDWNPSIWVLMWEYSARSIQWIPGWQGLNGFQKTLHLYALEESSLSIGRVNRQFITLIGQLAELKCNVLVCIIIDLKMKLDSSFLNVIYLNVYIEMVFYSSFKCFQTWQQLIILFLTYDFLSWSMFVISVRSW